MFDTLSQLLPIFLYFGIGILLRRLAVADLQHGDFLLRFVFFVTLPLLILESLTQNPPSLAQGLLPLASILVNLCCMLATLLTARSLRLSRVPTGTLLVNTMIVNNAFMFPFILAVYGEQGFADAVLFDFGNALMMATLVYALAFRFGGEQQGGWVILGKVLKSPLVWALFLAVAMATLGLQLPAGFLAFSGPLAAMTGPLILIALGIHFSLDLSDLRLVGLAVFIRMGMGLAFGVGLASLFGFEGLTFIVVCLCAAAPIGFNALTVSSMAGLDARLSARAVSLSILIGLVYVPVLMMFFGVD